MCVSCVFATGATGLVVGVTFFHGLFAFAAGALGNAIPGLTLIPPLLESITGASSPVVFATCTAAFSSKDFLKFAPYFISKNFPSLRDSKIIVALLVFVASGIL